MIPIMLKNEEFYFYCLIFHDSRVKYKGNHLSFFGEERGLNLNFSPKIIISKSKRYLGIPLSLLAISISKLHFDKVGSKTFYDIDLQCQSFLKIAPNYSGDIITSVITKTCTKEKLYTHKYNLNK